MCIELTKCEQESIDRIISWDGNFKGAFTTETLQDEHSNLRLGSFAPAKSVVLIVYAIAPGSKRYTNDT